MNENLEPSTRLTPSPEAGGVENCNHRGHAREFSRDERGRVRMICSSCGDEVRPAPGSDVAA